MKLYFKSNPDPDDLDDDIEIIYPIPIDGGWEDDTEESDNNNG